MQTERSLGLKLDVFGISGFQPFVFKTIKVRRSMFEICGKMNLAILRVICVLTIPD